MKTKVILAIETSCDDTSIAILKNQKVLSNVTLSTIDKHCKYGGIVPEIAARGHEQCLSKCFTQALVKAKIKREQLTHIAYAAEPGLPGSIHVGKVFAKSMAFLLDIPLIPINHMMGHVFSFAINKDKKDIRFPFISLVASGGHTSIYLFKSFTNYKLLTKTNDDAIGETLDKIGRMLNLKYPGGISIDQIYCQNKSNVKLINHFQPNAPFSFSGMKTHILNLINQYKMKKNKIDKVSIASSLLKWVIDEILIKLIYYLKKYKVNNLSIGGGVSANKQLRKILSKLKVKISLPEIKYTGDNAAMIGYYAYLITK